MLKPGKFRLGRISMAGIGGIAQAAVPSIIAKLADPKLTGSEFMSLQQEAHAAGFELTVM